MATVYVFNIGEHGNVNPTLGLVAELVQRGERVIYYCTDAFRQLIEHTGAIFCPYPVAAPDEVDTGMPHFVTLFMRHSAALLPALIKTAREEQPDYIIYDMFCLWGWHLARYFRVPAISVSPTIALRPVVERGLVPDFFAASEADQLARTGVDYRAEYERLAASIKQHYGVETPAFFDTFPLPGDLTLCFTLRQFQPAADMLDERVQFVGPTLRPRPADPTFPLHRLRARRVLFISLGTVFNQQTEFYRRCSAAFGGGEYMVVMAVGSQTSVAELGVLPDNFLVRQFVPQLEVLAHTTVFLTHSGMGSVQEALYHGVPLVCYPQMIEQSIVASQVTRLGVGIVLGSDAAAGGEPDWPTPSVEQLRAAVEQVVREPSYQSRVAVLGEELRRCSAAHAADIVQACVQRRRLGATGSI